MRKLVFTLGLLALALVWAMALAVPTPVSALEFKARSDNAVVLRGIALEDVSTSGSPFGSLSVRLAVEGYPMDGPALVVCDQAPECSRIRRGDRLLVRGEFRTDMADNRVYVVARSLSLKEAAR